MKISGTSLELYRTARLALAFPGDLKGRGERLERMLRYIVASLDSDSPKISYIGVFLSKAHSVAWISHIKQLTLEASRALAALSTDSPTYHRRSTFLVLALVSFTSTSTWALLKSPALAALAPHMTSICKTVAGSLVAGELAHQHLNQNWGLVFLSKMPELSLVFPTMQVDCCLT